MSSTNILLITSEFPPQPGGIGTHAHALATHLQANGKKVTVLADIRSSEGSLEKEFDKHQPFKVIRIWRRNPIMLTYLQRIIAAFQAVRDKDTVLLSGKFPLWLGACLKLFYSKRYIAVVHGSEVLQKRRITRSMTNYALEHVDLVIAVSSYTRSLISKLNTRRSIVINNGFELAASIPERSKRSEGVKLITVGRVSARKGQEHVIRAMPLLLQHVPGIHYELVGIPEEQARLEKIATQLGVHDKVTFKGVLSESEKLEALQKSDIFVMLSQATPAGDVEGFGIAILEANALGLPAIGSTACGIEDAIATGQSGELITYDDATALLTAIKKILSDYDSYSEGAVKWSEQFTWERIIKQYLINI